MMRSVQIPINGMVCGGCAGTVRYALAQLRGVVHTHVKIGTAMVMYDPGRTNNGALCRAIALAGYEPVSTNVTSLD